jgi:tetratricopeptide (TPR) repeat protein
MMPGDPVSAPPSPCAVADVSRGGYPARGRGRARVALKGLVAVAVLALTGWSWHRSESLAAREAGRARIAYARGDLPEALAWVLARLDRRPGDREAAKMAAKCLSRLDFADAAEPYYRLAGALSVEEQHVRALGLVRANRREEAIAAYEQILASRPDDVAALSRQASVWLSLKRLDKVLELADRLIAIPEGAVIGYSMRGVAYHDDYEPSEAVAAFERVLALDPSLRGMPLKPVGMFWAYLADDLLAIGRPEDARRYLDRALVEHPDPKLLTRLGKAWRQSGHRDEAERCWRRAVAIQPTLSAPWMGLGRLALEAGRPAEAIPCFERAAALVPDAPEPPYSLSLAHRLLGHRAEAERYGAEAERLRKQRNSRKTSPTPDLSP